MEGAGRFGPIGEMGEKGGPSRFILVGQGIPHPVPFSTRARPTTERERDRLCVHDVLCCIVLCMREYTLRQQQRYLPTQVLPLRALRRGPNLRPHPTYRAVHDQISTPCAPGFPITTHQHQHPHLTPLPFFPPSSCRCLPTPPWPRSFTTDFPSNRPLQPPVV